ncbi:MAG: cytochrome c-type biogenesis CcmF C-terminal domain-containing protein [Actinomycetota bacterium]
MSAGVIGPVAIWLAVGLAVIALATGRRWALVTSALSGAAAALVLAIALVAGDFSLAYVAETTSLATPWPYRLAALWGGMDGSMLFYTAMVMGIGAGAIRRPVPVRVIGAVGLGLLLITVLFANPFDVLDVPAVDGGGLLAILQHPAMIYHPPILYLGLTTLVVPFAFSLDMTRTDVDRGFWRHRVRRWLYVSWTLLTIGMVTGANWAYVELGWGGFWAWDPVENTALMPWIAATVFLHTSRIEDATGRWRRWNVMFSMLPFALAVMGVYLTRSGATGSIHSFAEDPVVGRILLVSAAAVGLFALVLAIRSEPGESWGPLRLDRNGWLATNALLLTLTLVFITAGSAYPAFVSVFRGETVTVNSRFFVLTVLPVAVAIAVGLAVSIRRSWTTYLLVAVAAAVVSLAIAGWRVGALLFGPAFAAVALLAIGLVRGGMRGRRLTIYLAHLGMAVLLVGVAGSSFGGDFTGSMRPGESVTVAGHELVLRGVETGEADRYVFVRADFDLDGAPISPEIRGYEEQTTPVAEPALRAGLVDDVIVAVSLLFPDGETVEVSVFVRPLVMWVWAGAGLIALAGLVALFGRGGAASGPRRSATAEPRSGETTTDTAAR